MKNLSYWTQFGKGLSRWWLYIRTFGDYFLVPRYFYRLRLKSLLRSLSAEDREYVRQRVEYYNRLSQPARLNNACRVGDYHFPFGQKKKLTKYFFDLYEVVRYFPSRAAFCYIFGDVTTVPAQPTFVKSRPIHGDNACSVLLKLNKWRHFRFVNDKLEFAEKKDMLVNRTTWSNANPLRRTLNEKFCQHPMCNVGKTRMEENEQLPESVKEFLNIPQQLEYKFIACIEGNDVATSLKWVMSSNSIAVSPPLNYETWFMEGTLIPDYHYIEVKPDYSDLIEKMNYYIAHPQEAEAIIQHAHEYVRQFQDRRRERIIQLMVADKYFKMTQS